MKLAITNWSEVQEQRPPRWRSVMGVLAESLAEAPGSRSRRPYFGRVDEVATRWLAKNRDPRASDTSTADPCGGGSPASRSAEREIPGARGWNVWRVRIRCSGMTVRPRGGFLAKGPPISLIEFAPGAKSFDRSRRCSTCSEEAVGVSRRTRDNRRRLLPFLGTPLGSSPRPEDVFEPRDYLHHMSAEAEYPLAREGT